MHKVLEVVLGVATALEEGLVLEVEVSALEVEDLEEDTVLVVVSTPAGTALEAVEAQTSKSYQQPHPRKAPESIKIVS